MTEHPIKSADVNLQEGATTDALHHLKVIIALCDGTRGPEDFESTPFETIQRHAEKAFAILASELEPYDFITDDILWQEIFSLRDELKIAATILKSYDPGLNTQEFLASLGHMDFKEYIDCISKERLDYSRASVCVKFCEGFSDEVLEKGPSLSELAAAYPDPDTEVEASERAAWTRLIDSANEVLGFLAKRRE